MFIHPQSYTKHSHRHTHINTHALSPTLLFSSLFICHLPSLSNACPSLHPITDCICLQGGLHKLLHETWCKGVGGAPRRYPFNFELDPSHRRLQQFYFIFTFFCFFLPKFDHNRGPQTFSECFARLEHFFLHRVPVWLLSAQSHCPSTSPRCSNEIIICASLKSLHMFLIKSFVLLLSDSSSSFVLRKPRKTAVSDMNLAAICLGYDQEQTIQVELKI